MQGRSSTVPTAATDWQIAALARLSIYGGVLLAAGEVVRNWGNWQWWPFWLVDFLASALLIAGGILALRPSPARRFGPLVGALGFSGAMGYDSFFGHVADPSLTTGPFSEPMLTAIIGVLTLVALASFVWALFIAGTGP